jgi:thymidylate kinase
MIDTKLILIEGLPGSGKSTTARCLASEIGSYGKKCKCFLEREEDHPVFIGCMDSFSEVIPLSRPRAKATLQRWEKFAKEANCKETINIMESCFWQTGLMFMYDAGASEDEISENNQRIAATIAKLKPVLIYFVYDNIEKSLARTFQLRNQEGLRDWENTGIYQSWEQWVLELSEKQKWSTDRGLKGREAWFRFFEEWASIAEKLYDVLTFPKIKILNPHSDWNLATRKIREFLELV